ncbi:MAG: hypothetical protein MUE71_04755 [Chitinophagaceae bacterium]|nr:hypothetical protein [Chitinophagaceae bacterium]
MKKVLIITYYWPPCGGIGVLRCLKFAKYLRQFGWEPVIFTAENAHYPSIDHSNNKDIPEGITILKQKIWEPYHIYKFITGQKADANVNNVFYASEKKPGILHNLSVWIRSNFFIPDARSLWIKPSVKFLLNYLKENPVDAIISNGPPHSNTRIATLVKKATGIPWLADFQDPWSQVDYFAMLKLTGWGRKKHLRMEQEVFRHANAISIVSPTWKGDLESIGAKNVQLLPWGFDAEDFEGLQPLQNPGFTITHTGILGSDRDPVELWEAINTFSKKQPGFLQELTLQLVGLVDTTVKESCEKWNLLTNVKLTGGVDRKTALAYTKGSSILLLVLNRQDNAEGRIPGKFFEYLASGRPIMAIGPENSDVARIMEESGAGYYCPFGKPEACLMAIEKLYDHYNNSTLTGAKPEQISRYSNQFVTGKVAEILNSFQKLTDPY